MDYRMDYENKIFVDECVRKAEGKIAMERDMIATQYHRLFGFTCMVGIAGMLFGAACGYSLGYDTGVKKASRPVLIENRASPTQLILPSIDQKVK